jgi:hypothetical protein
VSPDEPCKLVGLGCQGGYIPRSGRCRLCTGQRNAEMPGFLALPSAQRFAGKTSAFRRTPAYISATLTWSVEVIPLACNCSATVPAPSPVGTAKLI